ncbi:DEAD-box ATP-dependent RNA helicase 42 isoform X2 [Cynoglossus semilaevis]|uniref:DEAD-box ATP-dependent RNA helicase 42 isoform X2 n=1 Tax=Cynoglossus semilaevis TaxID=244447 RepID=UPI000D62501D|nr:DEAD-box ATP-dependent RNA helicase 42-like isoform X2 [Cynoglossus semilaevis]
MTHVQRFHGIPMSKSMRGLCKEEDYVFLGTDRTTADKDAAETLEGDRERSKDRLRRRLQREEEEKERVREMEEKKKEKEEQWRSHVEEMTCSQKTNLQERLSRIRRFRRFQRRVLGEEPGLESGERDHILNQLLTRM